MLTPKPCPGIPHPKSKWLLRKLKCMTLAAAFRCRTGGVLLCADREEDDGYNKREVDKIYRVPITHIQECDVFLAGAGPSSLITKAQAAIHGALSEKARVIKEKEEEEKKNPIRVKMPKESILADHVKLIEAELAAFYKKYSKELKESPVGFIVVVAPYLPNRVPMIYRTERAVLVPVPEYYAYGTGKALCDYFTDRLFHYDRMDKGALAVLAAFVLREAEASASGVGLGSDMVFIHDGNKSLHFIYKDHVKELQDGVPSLADAIQQCWQQNATVPDWLKA